MYTAFRIYAMIFGLPRFGMGHSLPHLSSLRGWQKATSLSRRQSRVWIDDVGHLVTRPIQFPLSTALAFLTKMSEKRRFTSLSAVQVENRRKKINIEEKLDVISRLENGRGTVDVFHNAYAEFVIMLMELKKVPSIQITLNTNSLKQGLFLYRDYHSPISNRDCSCSKTTTVLSEMGTVCIARLLQSYQKQGLFVQQDYHSPIRNRDCLCSETTTVLSEMGTVRVARLPQSYQKQGLFVQRDYHSPIRNRDCSCSETTTVLSETGTVRVARLPQSYQKWGLFVQRDYHSPIRNGAVCIARLPQSYQKQGLFLQQDYHSPIRNGDCLYSETTTVLSETGTVRVTRLPQSYKNEPYQWILISNVLHIAGYNQCVDKARNKSINCSERRAFTTQNTLDADHKPPLIASPSFLSSVNILSH